MRSSVVNASFLVNLRVGFCAGFLFLFTSSGLAKADYYRHVVFDNSLTPDSYFNSSGTANGGSVLELKDGRLPVETRTFLTPPNALRLQWRSQPGEAGKLKSV